MHRDFIGELELRPLTQADSGALFAITSQQRAAQFMRFGAHTSLQQTRDLIAEYEKGRYGFAIVEKETGRFLGYTAMKEGGTQGAYNLSILLDPSCWNKGVATFALRRMVALAQKDGSIKRLEAYVVAENAASRRVLEKQGFFVWDRPGQEDLPPGLLRYRLFMPFMASD